tara:strand:+ start:237 stop:530 length:294 start_codon:yes stop_codon:yes gene_type:complete
MILLGIIATTLLYMVCIMFVIQLWRDRHELLNYDWRDRIITREEAHRLEDERWAEIMNSTAGIDINDPQGLLANERLDWYNSYQQAWIKLTKRKKTY